MVRTTTALIAARPKLRFKNPLHVPLPPRPNDKSIKSLTPFGWMDWIMVVNITVNMFEETWTYCLSAPNLPFCTQSWLWCWSWDSAKYCSFASGLQVSSSEGKHQRETAKLQEKAGTHSFLSAAPGVPFPKHVPLVSFFTVTVAVPSPDSICLQFAALPTLPKTATPAGRGGKF